MKAHFRINFDKGQQDAQARLFSAAVLHELATTGKSKILSRLVPQTGLLEQLGAQAQLRDLYGVAFDTMVRLPQRHEYVYKNAVARKVLLGTHSLKTAAMLSEFRVGQCKADLVILNGTSIAFEIKSERDNVARLEQQVSAYLKVFALVNVVTGANHLDAVRGIVPAEVGIVVLSDRYHLKTVREAKPNRANLDSIKIFETLQRKEAEQVLQICGRATPDLPNTRMHEALRTEFSAVDPTEVHAAAVTVLKRSRTSEPLKDTLESLPSALSAAILGIRLRQCDRLRLVQSMDVALATAREWVRN